VKPLATGVSRSGLGLVLLLGGSAGAAAAQQRALPLPLTTGATIVQTLTFEGGDRESVHQVALASPEGLRFEWNFTEAHAGDTARQTLRYLEAATDLAGAHRLKAFHAPDEGESHPGYTLHAISRAVYRRLRSGVADSFQIMSAERATGSGLAAFGLRANRTVPVRWRGTLAPVGDATVPFPVLVNGKRVELPAVRVRGSFTARQGRWEPELLVLADSTYPLILKWTGAFQEPGNVLQTVRIDVPAGLGSAARGGKAAGELGGMLEGALASRCRVELPGIYFDFNSAALNPASNRAIASVAAILARHPDWTATLEGHTDSIGSASSNLVLSERRVGAVRQRLVEEYRVAPSRLRTAGIGSARPRESNSTVEGRARNRRVELVRDCANPERVGD